MENLLSSSEIIKLEKDLTNMCIYYVNKVVKDIQGVLTDKEKLSLKSSNPTIAKLCGLSKMHKPSTEMRSTHCSIGAPNYNLKKILTKKFNSFPKFQ